jgi:hypothetical protein
MVNTDFVSYLVNLDAGAQAGLHSLTHRFGVFRSRPTRGHLKSVKGLQSELGQKKTTINSDGEVVKVTNNELVRIPYNWCVWRSKKTRRPRTFATADTPPS